MSYNRNIKKGFFESLSENYQSLSENELDELLSERLSGLTESQAESFLDTLGNLGKTIGGSLNQTTLSNVLQGAAQGGATGATLGGPTGGLYGAGLGAVLGLLGGSAPATPIPTQPATPIQTQPATPIPTQPATPIQTQPATPIQTQPATPIQTQPATSTVAKLIDLVKSEKWDEVLAALIMGPYGKKCIPVGEKCIEIGEFLNSLKHLSSTVVREIAEMHDNSESYIESEDVDIANEDERTDYLIKLLNSEKGKKKSNLNYTNDISDILSEANTIYMNIH